MIKECLAMTALIAALLLVYDGIMKTKLSRKRLYRFRLPMVRHRW
jgi:hypothetical protein